MFTKQITQKSKIRVWLDEDMPAKIHEEWFEEYQIPCKKNHPVEMIHSAAIELCLFSGSRSMYGLLGAKFISSQSRSLLIHTSISETEEFNLLDNIAIRPDEIKIGMLEEYSKRIIQEMICFQENLNALPGGNLYFNNGAHGLVGSNEFVFGILSKTLAITIRLMTQDIPSEEILNAVVSNILAIS